jgi:hypothetical protein
MRGLIFSAWSSSAECSWTDMSASEGAGWRSSSFPYFLPSYFLALCIPSPSTAGCSLPAARAFKARSRPVSSAAVKRRSRYSHRKKSSAGFSPFRELHSRQEETRRGTRLSPSSPGGTSANLAQDASPGYGRPQKIFAVPKGRLSSASRGAPETRQS